MICIQYIIYIYIFFFITIILIKKWAVGSKLYLAVLSQLLEVACCIQLYMSQLLEVAICVQLYMSQLLAVACWVKLYRVSWRSAWVSPHSSTLTVYLSFSCFCARSSFRPYIHTHYTQHRRSVTWCYHKLLIYSDFTLFYGINSI